MKTRIAFFSTILIILIFSFFLENFADGNGLTITYPRSGVIFPPELHPPTIMWEDNTKSTLWKIVFNCESKEFVFSSKKNRWKPAVKDWEKIKSLTVKNGTLTITGHDASNNEFSSASIEFTTSKDSVGAPIFFRDVPLPFSYALNNLKTIRWRVGDISSENLAPIVMDSLHVCANCHSFSADGSTLGMDVDAHSDKDAYGITDIHKETVLYKMLHWSEFQDGKPTYGLLANISPQGRYIAATLKDNEFFITRPDLAYSQLFFPIKGIIVICDRKNESYFALPGASDTNYVQSNPSWNPEGTELLFARAPAIPSRESGFHDAFDKDTALFNKLADEFVFEGRGFKYDVYRVPFKDGKGGEAQPLPGASNNGKSNYFARISPDGKWIVFTQAKNFMLLQPDSKLHIMPAEGGEPRLMACNNSNMNSWHSWSPNGRWLVFSSKERGPYTKLYLTHIDENGMDSPPVCLENMCPDGRATNIPEFVNIKPDGLKLIEPKFLEQDYFLYQNGVNKIETGDLHGAYKDFSKAMELDPDNFKLYGSRGYVLMELGRYGEALEDLEKGVRFNPGDYKIFNLRGFARLGTGDTIGAYKDFTRSTEINPYNAESFNSKGYVLNMMGRYSESVREFDKAIELRPKYPEAYYERGVAKMNLEKFESALADFQKAAAQMPGFAHAVYYMGISCLYLNKTDDACRYMRKAAKMGMAEANQVLNKYCK